MSKITKMDFLARMRSRRERWNALLDRIEDHAMESAGVAGDWSARDIVAHVTAYERGLVEWLQAALSGTVKTFEVLDHPDVDFRNARILEEYEGQSWKEVEAEASRVFNQLMELLATISEEELSDRERVEWYVVPRWGRRRALWECIADDSYRHYEQHSEGIEKWLEERSE